MYSAFHYGCDLHFLDVEHLIMCLLVIYIHSWAFPDSSVGKESACNARDPGSIAESGRSAGEGISYPLQYSWLPCGSAGKESTSNAGDLGSIPGLRRSPGEEKGSPLQYSGLQNFMDCIFCGVTKSWIRLSDSHFIYLLM